MDFIFIEELRVKAWVGIYAREKTGPQTVELNLTFGVPDAAAERALALQEAQLAQMKAEMAITSAQCTQLTPDGVLWQTIIHCVFILSAIGIAWTDKLMNGAAPAKHAAH